MKTMLAPINAGPSTAPTGISGLDESTGGEFPTGRTTLMVGGPGSVKTIFGLQFLVHGALSHARVVMQAMGIEGTAA